MTYVLSFSNFQFFVGIESEPRTSSPGLTFNAHKKLKVRKWQYYHFIFNEKFNAFSIIGLKHCRFNIAKKFKNRFTSNRIVIHV